MGINIYNYLSDFNLKDRFITIKYSKRIITNYKERDPSPKKILHNINHIKRKTF